MAMVCVGGVCVMVRIRAVGIIGLRLCLRAEQARVELPELVKKLLVELGNLDCLVQALLDL